MPEHLTFIIDPADQFSSVDLLWKSLENIRKLLRSVDYSMSRRKPRQQWIVRSIKSSAPTLTLTPANGVCPEAVSVIGDGLRRVTAGTDIPPMYFSEPVLLDIKKMSRLFKGKDKARSIRVFMDGELTAIIEENIARQANRVLASGYRNLGSLQGMLEAISVHKSSTATIWEKVSGAPVRWKFRGEQMESIKELFGKQITVTGEIRYFANGAPRSITNVVAFQDATRKQYPVRASFGSIPDAAVQRMGVLKWLEAIRGADPE